MWIGGDSKRYVYRWRRQEVCIVQDPLLTSDRRREELGDAGGGGVSTVGSAEGIIDVHVERRSQLLGEGLQREVLEKTITIKCIAEVHLVVLLLLGVEAHVLKQEALAILEVVHHLAGLLTDAVLGDLNVLDSQTSSETLQL